MTKKNLIGATALGAMAFATQGTALLTKDENGGSAGDEGKQQEKQLTNEQARAAAQKLLDDAVSSVKEIAEEARDTAKSNKELSASVKEKADEALVKVAGFEKAMQTIEQQIAKGGSLGDEYKSAGAMFTESDAFKGINNGVMQKGEAIGFEVKTISSLTTDADGSMGAHIRPDRVVSPMPMLPQRRLFIRELIAPGQTNSNLVEFVQETGFTNLAAMVAEGGLKPKSSLKAELVDAKVKKIAHLMDASMEILQDVPALRSMIDQRLGYGLELVLENQILNGDGTGQNLHGIMTQATTYTAPVGSVVVGETQIDRLRLAFLQAALAEYSVDAAVLNPIDWANIELLKDADGRYIIGNPQGTTAPTLWGRSVVATQAQAQNTFLTGAFRQGAQLFDRMATMIAASTENKDNFEKNIISILAEMRVALAIYRTEAFVKGNFTMPVAP